MSNNPIPEEDDRADQVIAEAVKMRRPSVDVGSVHDSVVPPRVSFDGSGVSQTRLVPHKESSLKEMLSPSSGGLFSFLNTLGHSSSQLPPQHPHTRPVSASVGPSGSSLITSPKSTGGAFHKHGGSDEELEDMLSQYQSLVANKTSREHSGREGV